MTEDSKFPDFMDKFTDEQKLSLKKFVEENPAKPYNPQLSFENLGQPKKAVAQLEQDFKKKSFRDTALFWIAISSILLAASSLIVSIIALKK